MVATFISCPPVAFVTIAFDTRRALSDNVTAYLFEAEFASAGLARVVNPFPAISI
jgi:hypothetical protein